MSEEYIPEIYMIRLAGGKLVDCYFTNGAARRYDVAHAIALGGVFAPLQDQAVFERSAIVMDGVLAFDLSGKRDPFDVVDICADVVYEDGEPIAA